MIVYVLCMKPMNTGWPPKRNGVLAIIKKHDDSCSSRDKASFSKKNDKKKSRFGQVVFVLGRK